MYTPSTPAASSTPYSAITTPATVPTPIAQTCPTPGTYTFPATTVVVTETTTVCAASTTKVPSGTHTIGGVTTVVETSTTITCPYATTTTKPGGVVTSVILTTTYVCPSSGTYTIAPMTTTVTETEKVVVCPVVSTYCPGTYTAPAVVTTVTETDVVVYCPFSSPSASSTKPATYPAATTTTSPKETYPAKPMSSSTPSGSSSSSGGSTPKLGSGPGSQWAITYTAYGSSGSCKSAVEVLADLTAIKAMGFKAVRVYSTDCDTLPNVGAACEVLGLKIIIGVFIGEVGCDNGSPDVASQISAIKSWAKWDLVEMAVVGNEAINQGFCTPQQLKALIVEVKQILVSGGCNAPVTTTDTVNVWQDSSFTEVICDVVDVLACNSHAYFNADTPSSQAGPFVKGQLAIVEAACSGKTAYVMESGWPSSGDTNGMAVCSSEDQATAIASLKAAVGGSIAFFSFTDDYWKEDGTCNCEKFWGMGHLFGST